MEDNELDSAELEESKSHEESEKAEEAKNDPRDSVGYWLKWAKATLKASKNHRLNSKSAYEEYENHEASDDPNSNESTDKSTRSNPLYWASSKIIEPAFYSRTPKLVGIRRFDIDDPIAQLSGTIAERLGTIAVESCDFDTVMQSVVSDFIHADKAAPQVIYECDFEEVENRINLVQAMLEDGVTPVPDVYLREDGTEYTDEVKQDAAGFFGTEIKKIPTNQKVYLSVLSYDDVLHTPDAKTEAEIKEKAYYFRMSKDEATKRFPDCADKINWKTKKGQGEDGHEEDHGSSADLEDVEGEYIEGWECWSLPNKMVYWVSKQYQEGFLDKKPDPYGLKDFFPSPKFIIGSKPSKSLYPKPAYNRGKKTLKELHKLTNKVFELIHGIRRRALVDGANEDIIFALNDLEGGEFVAVENLQALVSKGDVDSLVYWIPVQELVSAIGELQTLEEKFKNDWFEWFGVPDILRGISDPIETLGAQQIKAQSAHDRFKYAKKQIQRVARDAIEMMVDLMLGTYSDEKIMKLVGFDYMSPEDKQRFPEALEILRDDETRMIRLDIETDSMNFVDEGLRASQMNSAVQTVTNGMKEIASTAEINQDFAAVSVSAVLSALEVIMPAGKSFQDGVKKAAQTLLEKIQNPAPPPPPPPDYEQMKLQIQNQALQLKGMEMNQKAVDKDREMSLKEYQIQSEQARKDYEITLKNQEQQAQLQIQEMRLELDKIMQDFTMQIKSSETQLQSGYLMIEDFKAKMQAAESKMEEMRLAREADANAIATLSQAQATAAPLQESKQPQVIVNIESPKVRKKTGIPVFDELGNLKEIKTVEELEDPNFSILGE